MTSSDVGTFERIDNLRIDIVQGTAWGSLRRTVIRSARFAGFDRTDLLFHAERARRHGSSPLRAPDRGQRARIAGRYLLQLGREIHLFKQVEVVVAAGGAVGPESDGECRGRASS